MDTRREFFKTLLKLLTGTGVLLGPLALPVRRVYASSKKTILPRGTKREALRERVGPSPGRWPVVRLDME